MAEKNSTLECRNCGSFFSGVRRHAKYCGSKCKWSASDARSGSRQRVVKVKCFWCGVSTSRKRVGKDAVRYCSRTCSDARIVALGIERRALKQIAQNWRIPYQPSPIVAAEICALRRIAKYVEKPRLTKRPCKRCNKPTIGTKRRSRTCAPCKSEIKRAEVKAFRNTPAGRASRYRDKALRRARMAIHAEAFDPISIFTRDNWTCQECGVATPRDLRGSYEANAPEIDHIVPLALGGHHTRSNVRCTCRQCNGLKGASAP